MEDSSGLGSYRHYTNQFLRFDTEVRDCDVERAEESTQKVAMSGNPPPTPVDQHHGRQAHCI